MQTRTEIKDRRGSFFSACWTRAHVRQMSAGVREKRMSFWEVSMSAVLLSASITGYTEQPNENHEILMNFACPRKPTCPPDVRGLNHVHALFLQFFTAASGFQLLAGVFARYIVHELYLLAPPERTHLPLATQYQASCASVVFSYQ